MKLNNLFKIFLLSLFIAACSNPAESTEGEPYIIGTITKIEKDQILVEENPNVYGPSKAGGEKIYLFISDKTTLLKQNNGSLSRIDKSHLKTGAKAKVWIEGPVLTS